MSKARTTALLLVCAAVAFVSVTANGAVTGFATGIRAGNMNTTGDVSVIANQGVTALAGNAVLAQSSSGNITVDTTGGTVTAPAQP